MREHLEIGLPGKLIRSIAGDEPVYPFGLRYGPSWWTDRDDEKDFFKGLDEAAKAGIEQKMPPGQIHSIKDLMLPAIARVGLITPRARELYEEAGIPIFEDPRVLEAMEGGMPQVQAVAAE